MENASVISTIILIFTSLVTYQGFRMESYREKYVFWVDRILIDKERYRLISSGFLHGGWLHFGFNMICLLSFGEVAEYLFGPLVFLIFYFVCMLGGSFLALWIHRDHGDYRALGASGAISGVIFASIILYPEGGIGFIFIPDVEIKSWIFGLLFIVVSIFGIKHKGGNIGHEAHLGGALTGMIGTFALKPEIALQNWWVLVLCLVPTIAFLILLVRNPSVLLVNNYWGDSIQKIKRNLKRPKPTKSKEQELNELLDKIRKNGVRSLTSKERARLKELRKDL